jgi:hypothetical protein
MLIALVMVTAPKSPGSKTSISPPAIVFARATAKVRQGDARVHGLVSLPSAAETHVWLACATPLAKFAATLSATFIVTEQALVPLQAPLQPLKPEPVAGVAVKVTCVPLAKLALQVAPQLIPEGELVTMPFPDTLTERV